MKNTEMRCKHNLRVCFDKMGEPADQKPKIILLFSGKRKSGKDYICEKIKSILGPSTCTIIRISEPLKGLYAKNHNLDLNELLSDGPYKENYRLEMINWSDKIRESDPGYFCKAACDLAQEREVWIISDVRRKTDIEWFRKTFHEKIRLIRIEAEPSVRESRGWVFTKGVDDVASECNLDDFEKWHLLIKNNNDLDLTNGIQQILSLVR